MVEISTMYEGGLRCRATHGPSGTTLVTDALVDNHGRGESFSARRAARDRHHSL
jgi:putative redox protein